MFQRIWTKLHHCSQMSANYRSIKRLTHSEIIKFLLQLVGDYRLNYFSWHQIFAFYCKFFFFNGTNLILLQKKDERSFICQKRDLINSCLHAVGFVKKKNGIVKYMSLILFLLSAVVYSDGHGSSSYSLQESSSQVC